jgi:hypothetical protein
MMDTTTWVIMGLLSAAGAGGLYLLYRKGRARKEEAAYYHRCPRCNRKLSYFAHQIGHRSKCSSCKEEFVLPIPSGREH